MKDEIKKIKNENKKIKNDYNDFLFLSIVND